MNDLAAWHSNNDAFLAAALAWLRARMTRLAEQGQGDLPLLIQRPADEAELEEKRKQGCGWFRKNEQETHDPEQTPRLPKPNVTDDEIAQAAAAMEQTEASDPPPALIILAQRLGLSRFERDTLLLCAAMELDTRTGGLCGRIAGDPARSYPTFALALALFEDPAWDVLSPERPLRYWRLLEINQPPAQPLVQSALRADERIVNYIKGLNYLDDRLMALMTPVADTELELPPSHRALADEIARLLHPELQRLPMIQLLGSDGPSKEHLAACTAADFGLSLYRMPVEVLPTQWDELENLARLWRRETFLLPVALYVDAQEADRDLPALSRFLDRCDGIAFIATREQRPDTGVGVIALDVEKPTWEEQQAAWSDALGSDTPDLPRRLAGQFNLGLHQILQIAATAGEERNASQALWGACLAASRPRLQALAQRIEALATWDQIVLPEPEHRLLEQIAAQVSERRRVYQEWGFSERMNRGLGISVLFAGDSGTGKTMAAEVIANELALNLYRIDLSAVVSKYIGETEKNLRRVFDAAEDGGAILFFDEADALFGKRSEVKDSHDRYANIEINYLLQRMEAYQGLAVLATNRKGALDPAFMRRLRFVVNFPFPGEPQRKRIWEKVFPRQTPTERLDFDWLARISLTGGSIQNIAINAAFMAAGAGSPVTMPLVLDAARGELRKLEQPVNEADFRMVRPAGGTG